MDKEKVHELKEKHGQHLTLLVVTTTSGEHELVVKKPGREVWNRFREAIATGPKERVEGGATLIRDCLVYPEWQEFLTYVQESPAIEDEVTGEITKLARAAEKVVAKKL